MYIEINEEDIINIKNAIEKIKSYPGDFHDKLEVFTLQYLVNQYEQNKQGE